jgi:predicted alpha/beta-fold hydrolase
VLWPARFVELLAECERIRHALPQLKVPTVALQSCKDELVSDLSIRDLEKNEYVRVVKMENAGHFGYEGEEQRRMLDLFRGMVGDLTEVV